MELFGNSILYNVSKLEVDIELNLTNCSSSNQSTKSSLGSTYTTNIYPDEHNEFSTFSVYMGGVDITSQVTTYNVGYNTITIPLVSDDISITSVCELETYSIAKTLTGCTSSNSATSIQYGSSYTTTITASPNYTMEGATVAIIMGGVDITSSAWDSTNNTITINNVTGNIAMNIAAVMDANIIQYTLNSNNATWTKSVNVNLGVDEEFGYLYFNCKNCTALSRPFKGTKYLLRFYNGTSTVEFRPIDSNYKLQSLKFDYNGINHIDINVVSGYSDITSSDWVYSDTTNNSIIQGSPVSYITLDITPILTTTSKKYSSILEVEMTLVKVS